MGWLDDVTDWVGDALPWGEKSAGWRAEDYCKRVWAVRDAHRNHRLVYGWRGAHDRVELGSIATKAALGFAAIFGGLSLWGLLGGSFALSWAWSGTFLCAAAVASLVAASGRRRIAEIGRQAGGALPELIRAFGFARLEFNDAARLVEETSRPKSELESPLRILAQFAETIEAYDRALHEDRLDQLSQEHRALAERVHERIEDLSLHRRARRELDTI